jgi:Na+/proline symporter
MGCIQSHYSGETFDTGPMIVYVNYGIALAYVVGLFTVVPLMYPLHLTSVFHYLEMRFQSKAVRILCTVIGMLQTVNNCLCWF